MNTEPSDDPTPAAVPVTGHAGETTHPDPITGEPGAHPVGVGVGAVSAGLAGAAIGAIAGPLGALVGAAIGAVAGGIAGHEVAAADDEPVSLADQPVSTDAAAEAVLPAAGMAGLHAGGVPGTVLSTSPVMGIPAATADEPAGQFHEAFTTQTWQEAAAEDQIAGDNEQGAASLPTTETGSFSGDAPPKGDFDGLGSVPLREPEAVPLVDTIRTSAYFRYLHRNALGEPGDALGDWVSAEREIAHL